MAAVKIVLSVGVRGLPGQIDPADRVRIDAAIQTAETINARMAETLEARDQAVAAAQGTAGDAQATAADRQQAAQAASDAEAARAAAEQERQAAEAAALSAQPYASRAIAQATTIPAALNYINIGGLLYRRDPLITSNIALTTGGGVNWSPAAEITPFHFGDGAAGWQVEINAAIAYAAATGRNRVAIPATIRSEMTLSGPIAPISGVNIHGIGNPVVTTDYHVVLNAVEGLEDFRLTGVTFVGPYSGSSYMITLGPGSRRNYIDVTLVNGNSGITVTDAPDNIIKVRGRNIRGTLAKLTGAGSVRNHVLGVVAENVTGFGLLLEKGACDNRIDTVYKFVNLNTLPEEQKGGTQWDEAAGRLGLEALGITIGCNRNRVGTVTAISTHDNGVSITGDYNTIEDVTTENCDHEGVHFYGSYNTVGFLRARSNRMSAAGAGTSSTEGGGSWNTILNGVGLENTLYCARFSNGASYNDIRMRSLDNVAGDSYAMVEAGPGNTFNAYPNTLNTSIQTVAGDAGAMVQTVTGSAAVPEIKQAKVGTDGIDVSSGTSLSRWSVSGMLGGVQQVAARIATLASSITNGILQAKMQFLLSNPDGVLRPVMVINNLGRVGIAKSSATVEYSPGTELDVDGVTRLSSLTLKSQAVADYAGADIDVTYVSALHIGPINGGATLGALTTAAPGNQLLLVKNTNSNPLTITHSSSSIRTSDGEPIVLGANKCVLLERASGSVWDEVGTRKPTEFVTLQNTALAAYDGSPVDATGRGVLSIAPAATGTILGALSSSTSGYHVVVIVNTSANTLVIPHATSGFRLNGKTNVTLGAYESIMLMHISGTIWQQI